MTSARATLGVTLLSICALAGVPAGAQQFNSDSYISKPHGMVTSILTTGEHTTMYMMTFSLFPNWEFTAAGYIYNTDADRKTAEGTQGSLYAKYMFYENKEKTGRLRGQGRLRHEAELHPRRRGVQDLLPDLLDERARDDPVFRQRALVGHHAGLERDAELRRERERRPGPSRTRRASPGTRRAPVWAIVGEAFGATGEAKLDPEYKVGLRYEPNAHVNIALSYGAKFNGDKGAGWEIGAMLFCPPFLCFSGCK